MGIVYLLDFFYNIADIQRIKLDYFNVTLGYSQIILFNIVTLHYRAFLWCRFRPIHSYQLCSSIVFTFPYFYCGLCFCAPMESLQNYEQTSLCIEYKELRLGWYQWMNPAHNVLILKTFNVYEICIKGVIAHNSAPFNGCRLVPILIMT